MVVEKEELVEGGTITIFCKKCNAETQHLLKTKTSEKVKIHCNSCGKNSSRLIRRLLKEKSPSERGRRRRSLDAKKAPLYMEEAYYEELSKSNPKPYSQQGIYVLDDVIEHKTFGLGRIVDQIGENKIFVLFYNIGEKKLICSKVSEVA
ncbi:MAG: hypothetical protein A2149_09680 [Candidatus Schekmanbacteria bacterium RBG_16_38_11]|uniref:Uncharacterized protein n=1 Tax=Candidatus Schekmanbacteria bacterium RBG_16_38_11 TaxID=1817880 RepID=A0A1F7RUG5_9BACT|nr:MAG: hypothetical protein A2149_09680 [Candidatus Schekmanbacteria bacterium RBG_16_38_11]